MPRSWAEEGTVEWFETLDRSLREAHISRSVADIIAKWPATENILDDMYLEACLEDHAREYPTMVLTMAEAFCLAHFFAVISICMRIGRAVSPYFKGGRTRHQPLGP
jgi:hypothetical protein